VNTTDRPAGAPISPAPHWEQPGITSRTVARTFLDALRRADTLVLPSADNDSGYFLSAIGQERRGHGAGVSRSVIAASEPPAELLAYHRTMGLAPTRFYCPVPATHTMPLAQAVLEQEALMGSIRADRSLERMLVAYKDHSAERLMDRLGLAPAYCAPPAAVYETANDKLGFAQAAEAYGFAVVALEVANDVRALDAAFASLSRQYGHGCILRRRRGAGGHGIHRARSAMKARRIWQRLHAGGDVLVAPYIPASRVLRDVAVHGIVTADGFAPLAFADQLVSNRRFRGGRVSNDWSAEEIAAIKVTMRDVARWLRDLGYVDAPAGVDGFLMRQSGSLRFVALDPNIRLTGTMLPWTVAATLSEAAGRRFTWQVETFRILGRALDFDQLRRRLGEDLLNAARLERGGVLPSIVSATYRLGALGGSHLSAILLAHDRAHLDDLRSRVQQLGILLP
jgi:hypothetical protein